MAQAFLNTAARRLLSRAVIMRLAGSATAADLESTTDIFCGDLQRVMTHASIPAATVDHPDWDSFLASKPSVRPLETEQFVRYEIPATREQPLRISCKLKSPDIIVKEYGPDAAGDAAVVS